MRPNRSYAGGLSILVALVPALVPKETASGSSGCLALPFRIVRADTIVVGTTISKQCEKGGPFGAIIREEFQVERVIKASVYQPGDIISTRSRTLNPCLDASTPPYKEVRQEVRFLLHGPDGEPHPAGCATSAKTSNVEKITRLAKISLAPQEYLESDDATDVELILWWIRWNYFDWTTSSREPLPRPGAATLLSRDTAVRYLLRQVDRRSGELYVRAFDLLACFHPDEALSRFVQALDAPCTPGQTRLSWKGVQIPSPEVSAVRGLSRLGDVSVVPILIERLRTLRTSADEADDTEAVEADASERWGVRLDRLYESPVGEYAEALGRLGDARAVGELLLNLDGPAARRAAEALGRIGDPRAIEPLLARAWENKWAVETLERFSDPRIAGAARERRFDHPKAPALLASQGDPVDKAFMRRLIRQGRPEGARWAAAAKDYGALPLLRDALENAYCFTSFEICYALGRLRDFDTIEPLLAERYVPSASRIGEYGYFLNGLADEPFHTDRCITMDEYCPFIEDRLGEIAEQEGWNELQRRLADQLCITIQTQIANLRTGWRYYSNDWVPPAALPDMPDPLFVEEAAEFLITHQEACRDTLRNGSPDDKVKILKAARQVDVNILDRASAVELLLEPSVFVKPAVWHAVNEDKVTLRPQDVRSLALAGSHATISSTLRYMARHAGREHIPVIAEVFRRGWHLYDTEMHHAICTHQVAECIEPLRGYLEGEHIELRRLAANTLAQLGDEAGKAFLRQDRERRPAPSNERRQNVIEEAAEELLDGKD